MLSCLTRPAAGTFCHTSQHNVPTSCHRSPQKACLSVIYLAIAYFVHRAGLLIKQGDCDADHVAIIQPQPQRYMHKQHLSNLALEATVGSCKGCVVVQDISGHMQDRVQ